MKRDYSDLPGVVNGTLFVGVSVKQIDRFPPLSIRLSGVLVHVPPEQYFLPTAESEEEFSLGIRRWDEDTIGLGLVFSRGFLVVFKQEMTGLAPASKTHCRGDDDWQAIGAVEWAPEVKPKSKTSLLTIIVIVLCVIILICIGVMIAMKLKWGKRVICRRKEAQMKQRMGYGAMPSIWIVCLGKHVERILLQNYS